MLFAVVALTSPALLLPVGPTAPPMALSAAPRYRVAPGWLLMQEEAAEPEMEVESRLLTEAISEALETLEARDAKVLRLYFGLEGEREHTLEEIGNMLGVTRERIRQLRDRALRRLREGEKGIALESFAA